MCCISEFEENEKKCVYFLHNCLQFLHLYSFTNKTSKPSHHNHSIIPLSNHHTIIIPKSHNLRNICSHLYSISSSSTFYLLFATSNFLFYKPTFKKRSRDFNIHFPVRLREQNSLHRAPFFSLLAFFS